jgi:hypothetical protein
MTSEELMNDARHGYYAAYTEHLNDENLIIGKAGENVRDYDAVHKNSKPAEIGTEMK